MTSTLIPASAGWRGTAAALVAFGLAFGFVEAAVVIDLRALYEPAQRQAHPDTPPGELFPALTIQELQLLSPQGVRLLNVEVARELATMVMLASVGFVVGGHPVRRFAAFLAAFGVWDLSYYVVLRLLNGWPASFATWDILFLIPVPWSSPVGAPMLAAAVMVACGLHAIARETTAQSIRPSRLGWAAVAAAACMIVAAFVANHRIVATGGVPSDFDWPLFGLGGGLALSSYVLNATRRMGRPVLKPQVEVECGL
jgi:hypothetical protein